VDILAAKANVSCLNCAHQNVLHVQMSIVHDAKWDFAAGPRRYWKRPAVAESSHSPNFTHALVGVPSRYRRAHSGRAMQGYRSGSLHGGMVIRRQRIATEAPN